MALALAAALACGALLELALRVTADPSAQELLRGLHRPAPGKGWLYELVPGARAVDPASGVAYEINAAGFRGASYPRSKAAEVFRIVLVGDSVSFGYGVALEETFADQLEARLRSGFATPRFEVLNLGVSGYNPYTESELVRGVGLAYHPDLVLVQFCINDLNDPLLHFDASTMLALGAVPDAAFPDPDTAATRRAGAGGAQMRALCDRSRLCRLAAAALGPVAPSTETVAALAPHEAPSAAEIAWLERLYGGVAADARAAGARLAVVVFPYETQLAPGAPETLQVALRTLGERRGIAVIDLLPAFRRAAAASGEPLFLDLWHPTARGHRVAAEEILRQLACERLLPGADAACPATGSGPASLSPSGS